MDRHTSTIPDARYTVSASASKAVLRLGNGTGDRTQAEETSVVKIGGSTGWWARGTVCCASIIVFAWCSAGFVLRIVGPELDGPPALGSAGTSHLAGQSAQGPRPRQSFSAIFGVATTAEAAKSIPIVQNTAYSLRGLFTTRDGHGFAMIETSGTTAVYRGQDRLPGGETVAEIGPDSVTLSGAQGLALLAFEGSEVPGAVPGGMSAAVPGEESVQTTVRQPKGEISNAVHAAAPKAESERRPPLSRANLSQQLLSADALSAARFTRVRARNGKIGLRIKWLRQDELTDAIGLRRGDVILAVNGLSVDDPKTMGTLIEALPASGEIVIDLERRNGPHRLVIPLSHG